MFGGNLTSSAHTLPKLVHFSISAGCEAQVARQGDGRASAAYGSARKAIPKSKGTGGGVVALPPPAGSNMFAALGLVCAAAQPIAHDRSSHADAGRRAGSLLHPRTAHRLLCGASPRFCCGWRRLVLCEIATALLTPHRRKLSVDSRWSGRKSFVVRWKNHRQQVCECYTVCSTSVS